MGGIRIHNKKVSPVAKDATKIASLIASFKFKRETEIMKSRRMYEKYKHIIEK